MYNKNQWKRKLFQFVFPSLSPSSLFHLVVINQSRCRGRGNLSLLHRHFQLNVSERAAAQYPKDESLVSLSYETLALSLSLCRAAKLCWIKVQELIIVVLEDIQSGEKMAIWLKFQSLIQNWRPLKSFYRLPLSLCLLNGTTRPNFPSSFSPTIVRWLRKQFYLEIW